MIDDPKRIWKTVRVGDALRLVNGRAFKPTEWKPAGLPIIRIQNLNDAGASYNFYQGRLPEKFLVNDGDLLFAWSGTPGTSFGAHIWRGGDAWLNQHIFKVHFNGDQFDKRFLQFAINQNLAEYIRAAHGAAGLAHITKGRFEASELPLPSLPEQRRIVAEIEKQFTRLEAGVAALKRVQAGLKRYRAAVLKAACTGQLVPTEAELARNAKGRRQKEDQRSDAPPSSVFPLPSSFESGAQLLTRILAERRAKWQGRGTYKEPAAPNTTDLPPLPEDWTWASVEQVSSWLPGSIQSGPFGSQLLHSEFQDTGILAIGIDNVGDGSFHLGKQHRISPEKFSLLKKFAARPRDVLVTVMATIGRVCVLPDDLEPAVVTKHCYRITPAAGLIDSRFLAIALRADAPTRWYLFGNVRGQTRPGLNGGILKGAPVPVPPPKEQTRIVAEVERRLSVIEELEAVVSANLQRAARLRQAILRQAFDGKLTS